MNREQFIAALQSYLTFNADWRIMHQHGTAAEIETAWRRKEAAKDKLVAAWDDVTVKVKAERMGAFSDEAQAAINNLQRQLAEAEATIERLSAV